MQDLHLNGFKAQSTPDAAPLIVLRDTQGALIRGSVAPPGCATFLQMLSGVERVTLVNNDLSNVETPFGFDDDIDEQILFESANRL